MWAASQNNAAAVKTLIELGADKNERSKLLSFPEFKWETSGMVVTVLPRGGWTPLMYAARDGAADAVGALADAKADLNATDPDGTTALMYAITNAHFDTAAVLIDKGADPNVADSTGHDGALFRRRHAHDGADAEPSVAEAGRHARRRGHRPYADREGRQRQRAAEAADHRPSSHADRRRSRSAKARRRWRARPRATTCR